jgi:V/A-type H+-transporting ATPase subunit I
MAVTKVKKVRILSHHEALDQVVAEIQKLGCCEIIGRDDGGGKAGELAVSPSDRSRERGSLDLDSSLSDVRFLLRFLEPLYKEEGGKLERMLGPKPPVSFSDLSLLKNSTDISMINSEARAIERQLAETRSELAQISNKFLLLGSIKGFTLPMWMISRGTGKVMGVMGTVSSSQASELEGDFWSVVEGEGDIFIAPASEKQPETSAVLVFSRSRETAVMESAAKNGFSRVECPQGLEMTPGEEMERLEKLQAELEKRAEEAEENASRLALNWVPTVRKLNDFLNVSIARRDAAESGESTTMVSILRFWVPADRIGDVEKALMPYSGLIDVLAEDPAPGDNLPILLDNPVWARPFAPLTKLYGMPSYKGIDPTILMAPFFFLFFGMCLGDGGYGLVMGAFFLFALVRYKLSGDTKNFFVLLLLGSVSTIIVGAVTGSWLGDMVDAFGIFSFIRPLKESVVLLRPMSDPITFLGISLALGVIQILFGILIAMWDAFRRGDMVAALGDQGGWFMLIVGILVWGAASTGIGGAGVMLTGKGLAALGALTLVATQGRDKPGVIRKAVFGVLSLYNVTSYLGDVLSYSRLLALGLATSAIAMIVNTLTNLVSGIPYVGWVLAALIFFGGHLFSVVVNVLGAFIHSLRLQYVEFFSKFYSGGGRIFSPLKFETKYTNITDGTME